MKIIDKALKEGRTTLSEYESKRLLAKYKIPITDQVPKNLFSSSGAGVFLPDDGQNSKWLEVEI